MIFSACACPSAAENLTTVAGVRLRAGYRELMLMVQCEFY